MKSYLLNAVESRKLYDKYRANISPRQCYNNIFFISSMEFKRFLSGEWNIAYGYMGSLIKGLYFRHCFILNNNECVIDPTIVSINKEIMHNRYFVFKVFSSINEHFEAIRKNSLRPSLDMVLKEEDLSAQKWAAENGLHFDKRI